MFLVNSVSTQQIDASFSCICPVIDHEFRHNRVKVAVEPSDPQSADYFDNVLTKFIVDNTTDARNTVGNLFFMIANCKIVRSRSCPAQSINYKIELMCLSNY